MFKNRLLDVLMAIAFIAAVGFSIGVTNNASEPSAPNSMVSVAGASDYYQRHPELKVGIAAAASDWFERHPELKTVAATGDLSDYFQRHRDVIKSSNPVDLSDWFQRHPELLSR